MIRQTLKSAPHRMLLVSLVLLGCLWLLGLNRLPGFDLDEALYRRIADEMKASGNFLHPTWDSQPFLEKPPTFFWLIAASSFLVDGLAAPVSPFAARLPAALASLFTVMLLSLAWPRLARLSGNSGENVPSSRMASPLVPVFLYCTALFPSLASGSILIDPILTAALTPLLIGIAILWAEGDGLGPRRPRLGESLCLGTYLAFALSLKGMAGLVTPLLALAVHGAFCALRNRAFLPVQKSFLLAPVFIVGIFLAAGFYWGLYFSQGEGFGGEFLKEFFIRQQLERSHQPLDGHSGPWFYYVVFVLCAGGALTALLGYGLTAPRNLHARLGPFASWGFPVSWALANLVFFSAMSTKLPGYVWPIWPALVLVAAYFLLSLERKNKEGIGTAPGLQRLAVLEACRFLLLAAPVVMAGAFLLLALLPVSTWLPWVGDARAREILSVVGEWPFSVRSALLGVGLSLACAPFIFRFSRPLLVATGTMVLANILLRVSIAPFVNEVMVGPWERLARKASDSRAHSCLTYPGWPLNATVSLNFRSGRVRHCFPEDKALTLSGIWEGPGCPNRHQVELATDTYLRLCGDRVEN